MDFLAKWINPIFAAGLWMVVFILIKPKRIKELLPVGIIAGIILFAVQFFLISLDLMRFNQGWVLVYGIPLLNPLWGIAAGILVINYMKDDFSKKIPMLFFFTIISEIASYTAVQFNNLSFLGKYNIFYDFIVSFIALLVLVHISEGLYGKRIYQD